MTFPAPTASPAPGLLSRAACAALDAADALAPLREQFALPAGLNYLDGNSLGVLPKATAARVQQVVQQEWGEGLIRSWNSAGWIDLPQRVGDKIARLVGAGPGELVVADSTSVNLFKVLSAAAQMAGADAPQRGLILSERSNFPTDLYIAQSVAGQYGLRLEMVADLDAVQAFLNDPVTAPQVALVMLTQVNYRSGRMADMAHLTRQAHAAGALMLWDLAHSAGAVPVDLKAGETGASPPHWRNSAAADFAVGCGYKYLNGGPGAPAFCWVHPRHAERFWQPLSGWMGHAAPFRFEPGYLPAPGIKRYLCGTPQVIGMAALECGVDSVLAAEPFGGMAALRAKSVALSELFIALVHARLAGSGLQIHSPQDASERGSQVSLAVPVAAALPSAVPGSAVAPVAANLAGAALAAPTRGTHRATPPAAAPAGDAAALDGYAVMQALIARQVVGDFRAGAGTAEEPHLLRFGFTPLYTRFVDVWDAVDALAQVLASGEWREARFCQKAAVT